MKRRIFSITKIAVFSLACFLVAGLSLNSGVAANAREPARPPEQIQNVLFLGNSYTARHNLAKLVKSMAEAGNPGLRFDVTTVIYGGRTMEDHWRLGSQSFVQLAGLNRDEAQATITSLETKSRENPQDKYIKMAIKRHQDLLKSMSAQPNPPKWDVVVLQSYRDDLSGDKSSYVKYAPKFAELAKAQGARVVLYETTPTTQNAEPLRSPPDAEPVISKAKTIARLAKRLDATVVPMSMVANHCQNIRPDLTLRFVNDAHLNQTLAYLTACTFYSALFDRSPVGLPINSVTDIRFLDNDHRDQDRDGGPLRRVYSGQDLADLQRIAWEGLGKFRELRASLP